MREWPSKLEGTWTMRALDYLHVFPQGFIMMVDPYHFVAMIVFRRKARAIY